MTGTPQSFAAHPGQGAADHDLIADMLQTVRLTGSVYMSASLSAPFRLEAPKRFDSASPISQLRHGSIFHLVASGGCDFSVDNDQAVSLAAGDIVLIPFGSQHSLWSGDAPAADLNRLFRPSPLKGMLTMNHGGGGQETRMVCGWVESAEFLLMPFFRTLPPYLIDRLGSDKMSSVLTSTVQQILLLAEAAVPGSELMLGRLMETLFVEVLRRYAAQLANASTGWLAAVKDPIVSRAMRIVHDDPARRWTVEDLARLTGTSRTVLAERFQAVMGRAPIEYVASWRMQLAADRLRNGHDSLGAIAADVGYESEAAFNRAFKRITGVTPGRWRDGFIANPNALAI